MSHVTRSLRRGLSTAAVAAVATGIAVSLAGPAAAAPASRVVIDTGQLIVIGTNHADNITLSVPAADTTVLEVDFADGTAKRTVKRSDFGQIQVSSRGGNDVVRIDYGAEVQPFTIIDTGDGNDTAFGGSGNELFRTGAGNDAVDGNRGTDTALLGDGSDAFTWDPGDGSDVIEGSRGQDTMVFNGAAAAEKFVAAANGPRLRFTRDLGNIVMDTDDVEQVTLNALGGADTVTVGDLRRTDVRKVGIDLGAQLNANGGDSAVDAVTVTGTPGKDNIRVSGSGGNVRISGLRTDVTLSDAEPTDHLALDTQPGKDKVTTGKLAPATITLNIL
ncbi:calcium-binding protein [Kribbella sp. NPDC051620]|uniref:calcium-binding protein n=1 Tax=Kribbella sp. NPDC051620 TaxID=3364120 RepID=UPI0037BE091E